FPGLFHLLPQYLSTVSTVSTFFTFPKCRFSFWQNAYFFFGFPVLYFETLTHGGVVFRGSFNDLQG
ncbi:MAG: hypothetical protein K2I21_03345, partial [Acetatifactor sp.]|nr:hypothetical protein [Acetatifactor sp.]